MSEVEDFEGFYIRIGYMLTETQDSIDASDYSPISYMPVIVSYRHRILRRTPKGVWIEDGIGKERFILYGATKRWAYPTLDGALTSFRIKKLRFIQYYTARIDYCKQMVKVIDDAYYSVDARKALHDALKRGAHNVWTIS